MEGRLVEATNWMDRFTEREGKIDDKKLLRYQTQYGKMDAKVFSIFDQCVAELAKRTTKSNGTQMNKREWIQIREEPQKEQFRSAHEAFKEIVTTDGRLSYQRKETGVWYNASVKSRLQFFKLKYKQ